MWDKSVLYYLKLPSTQEVLDLLPNSLDIDSKTPFQWIGNILILFSNPPIAIKFHNPICSEMATLWNNSLAEKLVSANIHPKIIAWDDSSYLKKIGDYWISIMEYIPNTEFNYHKHSNKILQTIKDSNKILIKISGTIHKSLLPEGHIEKYLKAHNSFGHNEVQETLHLLDPHKFWENQLKNTENHLILQHRDIHIGNFILHNNGAYLIDWDTIALAPNLTDISLHHEKIANWSLCLSESQRKQNYLIQAGLHSYLRIAYIKTHEIEGDSRFTIDYENQINRLKKIEKILNTTH